MSPEHAIQAILLGILQGLTEFLPISSSGHLLLVPWLAGWEPFGLTFDVMVHFGTLLAVLVYFRSDWRLILLRAAGKAPADDGKLQPTPSPALLIVATMPAAVLGGLLRFAPIELRSPPVVIATLTLFGLVLWWADRRGSKSRSVEDFGYREAFVIGLAQSLALVPGVSRSGVTITAGLFLGFKRWDSARFSFLIGTPIIALASGGEIIDFLTTSATEQVSAGILGLGVVTTFVSGLLCINYFLRFLKTNGFLPFVIYRITLAAILAVWWLRGSLVL